MHAPPRTTPLSYMPQLDSLRGWGVLIVFFHHFARNATSGSLVGQAAMGMFFCLSSYLITGILLRSRAKIESGQWSFGQAYGHYFIRRALRIFPAYYALLIFAMIIDSGWVRRDILWHATYTSNIFVVANHISYGPVHFWSLSVEEQFYLLWPFFMLLAPRRSLPGIMLFFLVGGLVYRSLVSGYAQLLLTPSQFDYIALGAMLAMLDLAAPARPRLMRFRARIPNLSLLAALALLASAYLARALGAGQEIFFDIARTSFCFFALWLVAGASVGFKGLLGWLLELRFFVYLGAISYGAYLIHGFVPWWFYRGFRVEPGSISEWITFPFFSIICIIIAALSWRFFEGPILNLKDRFAPIKPRHAAPDQPPSAAPALASS